MTTPASVVIVTWNGRAWLDRCIGSVMASNQPPVEVIVVDNGSTDGTVEHVHRTFPTAIVVALEHNRGFAGGNNEGARRASQPYLVFLNNDCQVAADWLAHLLAPVRADPTLGLVTSRIVFLDRPDTIDSAGDGYLRCGGAFKRDHGRVVGPAEAGHHTRHAADVLAADGHLAPVEVFGACGAAFLIRRDLFEELGGFDEAFFMVYEDVDLSYRARLRGARCAYAPAAVVRHAGSRSIGHVSGRQVFLGQRNLEWTWIKNTPARLLWRSWLSHAFYDLAGAAGYARQGHLGAWIRGKLAAVAGMPRVLQQRRAIQRVASADPEALWRLMEPDWIGIKRREKAFDFGERARSVGSKSNNMKDRKT
jgi:GT2 family glycosyltransferase